MFLQQISEPILAHHAYLIGCKEIGEAIIIDPQRDVDRYIEIAARNGFKITAAADTHIHADYLSGLRQLADRYGVKVYASAEGGDDWQYEWLIGSNYRYKLLKDKDSIVVGSIRIDAIHTPGHTPEHLSFLITDLNGDSSEPVGIITGDFVFVGDVGRPDLLETTAKQKGTMVASARDLFGSIQRFKTLSPSMSLWPGHGAGSICGKSLGAAPMSTVGHELSTNCSVKAANEEDSFVEHILTGQPEPPQYFARMKKENREGPTVLKEYPNPKKLTDDEVTQIVNDDQPVLIDLRPWEDYRDGHIKNSLHMPLNTTLSTMAGSYLKPDDRFCLISEEAWVNEIVAALIRIGIDDIPFYMTPNQVSQLSGSGNNLVVCDEIGMMALPDSITKPDTFLLDVRGAVELVETGFIGDACQIAHTQLAMRIDELPRDRNIHVYCRTGNRSRYASSYLESQGLNVTHVDGGIVAWIEMGGQLSRIDTRKLSNSKS